MLKSHNIRIGKLLNTVTFTAAFMLMADGMVGIFHKLLISLQLLFSFAECCEEVT